MSGLRDVLQAALAGRYLLEREVGAGGMATVWLAHDVKHDRKVAIKVLRPELGLLIGATRFLAEIRTTANLQHPHLLPLFDSGEVRPEGRDGPPLLFYVMPWVAGESLRARLARERQLPVDEAVRLAREVAGALDYAHRQGIVHRDVKPENILLHDGRALVADFGIALALSGVGARLTETGLSVGTPAYMSPEQAMGERDLGPPTDVYALGAVTYEMLVGEPPFTGVSAQAVVARVVTEPPRPIRTQRHTVPPHVEAAVLRALEKLPADRFATAAQFAEALAIPSGDTTAAAPPARLRLRPVGTAVVAGGAGLAALLLGLALGRWSRPAGEPVRPPVRYLVGGTDSTSIADLPPWPAAIAPDGGAIAYPVMHGRDYQLYLRTSDQVDGRPLPGTEQPFQPVFSPDGRAIAFESGDKERVIRLGTGEVREVATGGAANGADWLTADALVLGSTGNLRGLVRLPVAGGRMEPLTAPDTAKGELDHLWPVVSADGGRIAFAIWRGTLATSELATTDPEGRVARLGLRGIRPLALLDDHLVYVQADGAVLGVRLGRGGTTVVGAPVPVHEPVEVNAGLNGNSEIFVSRGGAAVTSRRWQASRIDWLARDGTRRAIGPERRTFLLPRLSPDGGRVAVLVTESGRQDVWLVDVATGTLSRLTTLQTVQSLAWSGDGRRVVFTAPTENGTALWAQEVGSSAPATKLRDLPISTDATLAPDGRTVAATSSVGNQWQLLVMSLDTPGGGRVLESATGLEFSPAISPDGRWLAHLGQATGHSEVYLRSFPDGATKVQVSAGGGTAPVWSADGRRVYYLSGEVVVAATLQLGPEVRVLSRDTLFTGVTGGDYLGGRPNFDVSADGTRLVVPTLLAQRFELVVEPDWRREFLARVRGSGR